MKEKRKMIVGESFVWLHMPKTGGTTMNRLFREYNKGNIVVDSDGEKGKHDSISLREAQSGWRAGTRKRYITIRKLEKWLISDWLHKKYHYGIEGSIDKMRQGLFYSLREGGTWLPADWWLKYFDIDKIDAILRLEHLEEDVYSLMRDDVPGIERIKVDFKCNRAKIRFPGEYRAFSADDQKVIRDNNPMWAAVEEDIYKG